MTTNTPYLNLVLYNSTSDQSALFSTFRADIAGIATTSNFYKIDTFASGINSRVTTLETSNGNPQEGFAGNLRISPSVTSNNLTVAIKTFAGTDPTTSDVAHITLGGAVRSITSALSMTMNAGTNWMNLGSSELQTLEQQLFVYIGFNSIDGVVIAISRIPYATKYSDFNTTNTNARYAAISTTTNAAADDPYFIVGRFSATLSAGSSYNWSVPTFTPKNLKQYHITETDWMSWNGTITASGSMTTSGITTPNSFYQLVGNNCNVNLHIQCTLGGTASTDVLSTLPISAAANYTALGTSYLNENSGAVQGQGICELTSNIDIFRYNNSNFTLGLFLSYTFGTYPIK